MNYRTTTLIVIILVLIGLGSWGWWQTSQEKNTPMSQSALQLCTSCAKYTFMVNLKDKTITKLAQTAPDNNAPDIFAKIGNENATLEVLDSNGTAVFERDVLVGTNNFYDVTDAAGHKRGGVVASDETTLASYIPTLDLSQGKYTLRLVFLKDKSLIAQGNLE